MHVTLEYETGDAAGQNGVTKASWVILEWIQEQIKETSPSINIQRVMIEGSGSGDKKVASGNHILGRGVEVQSEAYIPESVLKNVLKVRLTHNCCLVSRLGKVSVYREGGSFSIPNRTNIHGLKIIEEKLRTIL